MNFVFYGAESPVAEQVIIQTWISSHSGVISKRPPPRRRGFSSSRPSLLLPPPAVKPHFAEFSNLPPSKCLSYARQPPPKGGGISHTRCDAARCQRNLGSLWAAAGAGSGAGAPRKPEAWERRAPNIEQGTLNLEQGASGCSQSLPNAGRSAFASWLLRCSILSAGRRSPPGRSACSGACVGAPALWSAGGWRGTGLTPFWLRLSSAALTRAGWVILRGRNSVLLPTSVSPHY
jgi:hypothetical protein